MMRLDRFLSEAGVAGRKELKTIIKCGRVTVNGTTATKADVKLDETTALVTLDGVQVSLKGTIVLMLHKPAGYVTSTSDPRDATVMELLPQEYKDLFPIGRLDKDTEGLLLFTNDGDLGHRMTSPKTQTEKEYFAKTEGIVDQSDCAAFEAGIVLRDGTQCLPAKLRAGDGGCYVTICEGKYHQVRRMLASRGKPVLYLKRIREGNLTLGDLAPGEYRLVKSEELEKML